MRHWAIQALAGFGLGIGFALLELAVLGAAERVFPDHTVQPMRSLELAFRALNAPAEWLGVLWYDVLHLPPHHELAWVLALS